MSGLLVLAACAFWRGEPNATHDGLRSAVARALAPIERSVQEYANQRHCFSCHHQAIPALALNLARSRGFDVSEASFDAIDVVTTADLDLARSHYEKGQGQGGGATRAGYALWALSLVDHEPDDTTRAVANFLSKSMRPEGAWRTSSNRPPSEASWLTTTGVALKGIALFGAPSTGADQTTRARDWLLRAPIEDTEDAVFRLWGLRHSGADESTRRHAAELLIETQNPDGGWSQRSDLPSDAYATGSALVALHQAGEIATGDVAYARALTWLLTHQAADGTWHVKSRSNPFQPYFESGFPYAKDQFISIAASAWATTALILACDPAPQ